MRVIPSREQDQRMEVAMAILLRAGVITAAVLVAVGGALVLRVKLGSYPARQP